MTKVMKRLSTFDFFIFFLPFYKERDIGKDWIEVGLKVDPKRCNS